MRQQESSGNFVKHSRRIVPEGNVIAFQLPVCSPIFLGSAKMAEISYTWWHAGEKNLVTFGDCFSESLFEDLDCQFNSEVSDGLVNVPDRVLESLTDVENWAENFGRTTGRDHQRAKNKGQIESKSNTCISSPAASASPPPSPCQDPLPQESKRQLGLLRFNFYNDNCQVDCECDHADDVEPDDQQGHDEVGEGD